MIRPDKQYTSNTLAGSANQNWFSPEDPSAMHTGRVFYRLFAGGRYGYSFLYSNRIDTTFADGSHSYAGRCGKPWTIHRLMAGICSPSVDPAADRLPQLQPISFSGEPTRTLAAAEYVMTDPIELTAQPGDYLCLEITFSGAEIPCHTELLIPCFRYQHGRFTPSTNVPVPGLVGCDRPVAGQIGFLGDSITQGIGTPENAYTHWVARTAEQWGTSCAYWNLGVGYARAADAAQGGLWLSKAMHCDFVSVCLGVNDLRQGATAEQIMESLHKITEQLRLHGVRYGLFTIPPFDYDAVMTKHWQRVNAYIRQELSKTAVYVFDTAPVWGNPTQSSQPLYGAHPNELGCEKLATAFCQSYPDPIQLLKNRS